MGAIPGRAFSQVGAQIETVHLFRERRSDPGMLREIVNRLIIGRSHRIGTLVDSLNAG